MCDVSNVYDLRLTAELAVNYADHDWTLDEAERQSIGRLGRAWLADNPADNDEPLTDDWLNGLSGRSWDHRGYSVEIGQLEYELWAERAGGPVELRPYHTGKTLFTRGDVRRVCQAIGLDLSEGRS